MKRKSKSTWGILSCVFILVLAAMPSCKKHAKLPDENDETIHAVKFKVKDFEAIVTPLKKQSTKVSNRWTAPIYFVCGFVSYP